MLLKSGIVTGHKFHRVLGQVTVMSYTFQWSKLCSRQSQESTKVRHNLKWNISQGKRFLSELSVKSFKEGWNQGFDLSMRIIFIKSLLASCVLEPILKVGWNFWDLLVSPLKVWELLESKKDKWMGSIILNPISTYAGLAWPIILLGQTRKKKVINSPTPLFVHDILSIKETWVTLC